MHALAKLSVYEPDRAELSPGDSVRITRNDKDLDLANGDRFKVASVEPGRVTLTNDARKVELTTERPLHLDHSYATTVHSSQGLTADRVMIDLHAQSRTTATDLYYVAISRARHEARIYTNDQQKLPPAIARANIKHAALDLVRERRGPERDRNTAREAEKHQEAAGKLQRPEHGNRTMQAERTADQGNRKADRGRGMGR